MSARPYLVAAPRTRFARLAPALWLLGAALLALGWWLGVVQEFLRFLINWPGVTVSVAGVLVYAGGRTIHDRRCARRGLALVGVGTLVGLAYLVRLAGWASAFDRELSASTTAPDSTFLPRRVLPRYVADEFARRSLTDARYALGSLEPTLRPDGRLVWQAPPVPNSLGTYFARGVQTIVEVDADTTRPAVRRVDLRLPRGGEGNFSSFARLIARTIAPLSEPQEPVYDTRARAALVPLLRWVWGIPSYDAVVRFDSLGRVDVLAPAEAAAAHPHLRLVPERLVYWQASRWGSWRRGLFGAVSKRGLLKIAEIGGVPTPTLLDDDRRGAWVVPMEPQGRSHGLAGVLFVEAQSGARRWWETTDQAVPSPSQALKLAVDDPRIALLKNAVPAEPKLGVLEGRIHYLVPIIPVSGSQVQRLVVVDAVSSRTVLGDEHDEVWATVRGGRPVARPDAALAPAPAGDADVIAERLDAMARTIQALQAQLDSLRGALPVPPAER